MTENEILKEFNSRYLNSKTNNYIFCEMENFNMLDSIPDVCNIRMNDCDINIEYANNIKIDLNKVEVKDILMYTLNMLKEKSLLDETLDYDLEFNNKFDLLKFQSVLRNYNVFVQLIFYNVEELSVENQMLFNELYFFNGLFFNVNSFIKGNNFKTYFLKYDRVLDNRENFTKIRMVNFIDKGKQLVKKK